MKNNLRFSKILSALGCFAVLSLASCSDWTEPESIGLRAPSFPNDNPELFARYTAELRNYKASSHQIAFGWFDNSEKQPFSQAGHLASVPDSMDIVSLLHPDNLADWEVAEFEKLREKGTQVIFTFNYAEILAAWEATLPPVPDPALEVVAEGDDTAVDGFLSFLAEKTDYNLGLVGKYGYDGVSVFYEPAPLSYLEESVRVREQKRQETFVAKLAAWQKVNAGKMFVFEGRPQNLVDQSLLAGCKYIVLRALDATSFGQLSSRIRTMILSGIPADRFIVGVETLPLDAKDLTTGRFADADGALTLSAVSEVARWVASPEAGFTKAGLGVYNLQNDYYHTNKIYNYMREAISTMDPAPKK